MAPWRPTLRLLQYIRVGTFGANQPGLCNCLRKLPRLDWCWTGQCRLSSRSCRWRRRQRLRISNEEVLPVVPMAGSEPHVPSRRLPWRISRPPSQRTVSGHVQGSDIQKSGYRCSFDEHRVWYTRLVSVFIPVILEIKRRNRLYIYIYIYFVVGAMLKQVEFTLNKVQLIMSYCCACVRHHQFNMRIE